MRGVDGNVIGSGVPQDACCAPTLEQIDPCLLSKALVGLLPSGPMWDGPKAAAIRACDARRAANDGCGTCEPCDESGTTTLVDFALMLGPLMADVLNDGLGISIRESSPHTAVLTIADWLDALGWTDCFRNACGSSRWGLMSPYAVGDDWCIYSFCPPDTPEPLATAVDQKIVRTLGRLAAHPRRNLAAINWVIEPLGAVLTSIGTGDCCKAARFCLSPVADTLTFDRHDGTAETTGAWYKRSCQIDRKIWPGLLAAHCVALSLIPEKVGDATPPIEWCNC